VTQDRPGTRIPVRTKIVYSLGDHTVNLVLSSLSLFYLFFLTDKVGLAPVLAGAVPWIARSVDAITDPVMGRISDHTRWRAGRRRPWFLIGALPFGLCFALLWVTVPFDSELAQFAYYTSVYVLLSLAMTVVSVPYLALIPEMARDYDDRTSFNTWRSALGIVAVFFAVGMSSLADALGDDAAAWSYAAWIVSVWLVLPWLPVWAVSWERPVESPPAMGFREGLRTLLNHAAYRNLATFYLLARTALDIVSAMFLFYIARVIGRPDDFEITLTFFLFVVVAALPMWLMLAQRFDKRGVFLLGVCWWIGAQLLMLFGGPEWPRWAMFAVAGFAAVGYAVADLMPWSMLPDVIDEDELETGERREGLYNGSFTFLRKVGGATAVLLAGLVLQLAGYDGELERQPESAVTAIRVMMGVVPAVLLGASAWLARRYPMSREAHREILARLAHRATSTRR